MELVSSQLFNKHQPEACFMNDLFDIGVGLGWDNLSMLGYYPAWEHGLMNKIIRTWNS